MRMDISPLGVEAGAVVMGFRDERLVVDTPFVVAGVDDETLAARLHGTHPVGTHVAVLRCFHNWVAIGVVAS